MATFPAPDSNEELQKLKKILTVPKALRKHLMTRCACFAVIFIFWFYINGGIFPFFLRQKLPMLKVGTEVDILYYFSGIEDDGANIKWAHGVNTKEKLERALDSPEIHMVEGDVMLRGQGTSSQSLVPVMAKLPATDGELTLDEWLDLVISRNQKGFKLDFQSIEGVEISLQKLKDRKEKIKVPVWLHADVFKGPLGGEPSIEPTRFIRTMKRVFPDCSLSLGWTTGYHTDLSQSGYTWEMVFEMYQLIRKWKLEPPLIFSARSSFIRNSVPQLKWLIDNTRGSILIWKHSRDDENKEDLMYIAYRFPPHHRFFDLDNGPLEEYVMQNSNNARGKVTGLVLQRDTVMFNPNAWVKMGFHQAGVSLLPSTEALVFVNRAVYIVSKMKYKPSDQIKLKGRVKFMNPNNVGSVPGETGLNIYVRSTSYLNFEHISGIRCFLGVDGQIVVSGSHLSVDDFRKTQRMSTSSDNCYRFSVVDTGTEIQFQVNIQYHCETLDSAHPSEQMHSLLTVPLPKGMPEGEHPFIIKLEDSKRTAILDELTIKYSDKDGL